MVIVTVLPDVARKLTAILVVTAILVPSALHKPVAIQTAPTTEPLANSPVPPTTQPVSMICLVVAGNMSQLATAMI